MATGTIVISELEEKTRTIKLPDNYSTEFSAVVSNVNRVKSPRILTSLNSVQTTYKDKADVAVKVYDNCSLVQNAINLYVDLVFHKLIITHSDANVQKIYEKVLHNSNIEEAIEGCLLDYFKLGNAFPFRFEVDIEEDLIDGEDSITTSFNWINLNPIQVEITGEKITEKGFSFEGQAEQGMFLPPINKGKIDDNLIYHISYKKPVREKKASPPIASLARAVDAYNALLDSDITGSDNAVNPFLHLKIGTGKVSGVNSMPKDSTVKKLVQSVRSMRNSGILITADTVESQVVDWQYNTLNPDKYKTIIEQIESGLGITREMITSSVDGGGSLQWFNITKLIKMLESARRKIQRWIEIEIKRITVELIESGVLSEIKEYPNVRLSEISIRDETQIRDILLKMYERGLISPQHVYDSTGIDFMVEMNRKALINEGSLEFDGKEIPYKELVAPPAQPFQGNLAKIEDGGDGRPDGTSKEQSNPKGEK